MKNWKTTLGGILSAFGAGASGKGGWIGIAGQVCAVIGPILLGAAATDARKEV